ncbi:MAG: Re/Si-specific NAD(P)(+) transhydrogenase subunit alpha [Neisseriaceae bacterium]
MKIGIPKETLVGENKVAATPSTVAELLALGFEVLIEEGAGLRAGFSDLMYQEAGGQLVSKEAVWSSALIYKVNAPTEIEIEGLKAGTVLVSFIFPGQNPKLIELLTHKKITAFAMDMVPRISRAQAMDALSAMANISGYRAVIESANEFGRFFSGQITAAGNIPPAKVLVVGAGVAGLAAVGTASSLGAVVKAFDTRSEVAEQVQSLGGEFLSVEVKEDSTQTDGYAKVMSEEYIRAEMELFNREVPKTDILITTAAIPGKPSPKLISKQMIDAMHPGSVIVDLAARGGGNCEYTEPDARIVTENGVIILGYMDMASRLPIHASQLYATNLLNLTKLLTQGEKGQIKLNWDDVIVRHMAICHEGELMYPPPPVEVTSKPLKETVNPKRETQKSNLRGKSTVSWASHTKRWGVFFLGLLALVWLSLQAPAEFFDHLTVFMLACVLGYYVVWNVDHSLHTPLMSETNAISGIVILGALMQTRHQLFGIKLLAFIGIILASINIFGGFSITQRMLNMFHKD